MGVQPAGCAAPVLQSNVEINGLFLSSLATSFGWFAFASGQALPRSRRSALRGGGRLNIERCSGLVLNDVSRKVERDGIKLHQRCALFDPPIVSYSVDGRKCYSAVRSSDDVTSPSSQGSVRRTERNRLSAASRFERGTAVCRSTKAGKSAVPSMESCTAPLLLAPGRFQVSALL